MKHPITCVIFAACMAASVSACASNKPDDAGAQQQAAGASAPDVVPNKPQLLAVDQTGITASQEFVTESDTVVIASKTSSSTSPASGSSASGPAPAPSAPASTSGIALAGVQKAKELKAPLLIDDGTNSDAINSEISRLGADKVERVEGTDTLTVAQVLEGYQPTTDGTVVLVTNNTDVPSVLAAMAAGFKVELLPTGDPRASVDLMAKKDAAFYAVGADFGTEASFNQRIDLAQAGPVPGAKTGLIFPGRRIVALYGHPSGPALGLMGDQPPQEAVKRVNELVKQYQAITPNTPTVPAFEVIATVASSLPGGDGDYSNESTVEELRPYVEAIGKAGGFAVLDLQPGHASFLSQAQRYQELLELPYVGLALDPEWKIRPDEKPLGRVGNTTAAEINEVSAWLAEFTRSKKLPQKLLIMHQFQVQMIQNREQLDINHPELCFVLHADGHGNAHDKLATWDRMREGLQPGIFLAWKNFIDEDAPMFDPRQTLGVQPTPWFISYQ